MDQTSLYRSEQANESAQLKSHNAEKGFASRDGVTANAIYVCAVDTL
jgi:hypothetical protein